MKYFQVFLSTYRVCIIRAETLKEAQSIVLAAIENGWTAASLGTEIRVFDEIPSKEEWLKLDKFEG